SQETILGGIKAICKLVEDKVIDSMEVNDLLKIINLVGVACDGPIGDYPDPMTWRVNEIFPGCYVSLSDVLMAHTISHGKALQVYGTQKAITNVIPIYDDNRIHVFLRKYSPSLLEYMASVGMRRMIAEIPRTYSYTIV